MSLRINEVAQAAGVNWETLRYYERRGLLGHPERSPGGHRLYDDRTVQTLRIIKASQRLGFTLDNLLSALDAGCDDLHECSTSECCPLPFAEITRTRDA